LQQIFDKILFHTSIDELFKYSLQKRYGLRDKL